jgi:hypothetical protein
MGGKKWGCGFAAGTKGLSRFGYTPRFGEGVEKSDRGVPRRRAKRGPLARGAPRLWGHDAELIQRRA